MWPYNIAVGQTNYSNLEDIQTRIKEFESVMQDEQERNNYDLIVTKGMDLALVFAF